MNTVFVNDCAADGCYKKNMGNGKQMCKHHQEMYESRQPFKAFYGKTVLKKTLTCRMCQAEILNDVGDNICVECWSKS